MLSDAHGVQDTGVSVDFPYDWQEERGMNFGCYLHPSNVENGCLHGEPSLPLAKCIWLVAGRNLNTPGSSRGAT